ncbi:hypothetical protein [Zooshikella ganghwensis]|uniref:hypothetical protein n=1 Tax=Zooshikella ganghwensis TaxID=202772 RepID=UPI000424AADE|nr:hypothetical protein [Zooshikella ganghwensis]
MVEILLTKMNPKSCVLNERAKVTAVQITGYDIAAALSFGQLSKPAYYFARAKYCDDIQAAKKLEEHLIEFIHCEIVVNNWSLGEGSIIGITELLIEEGVYGVRCKKCKGNGNIYIKHNQLSSVEDCTRCSGSGFGAFSQRERARTANIPLTTWNRHWERNFQYLLGYIEELNSQLIRHMSKQFEFLN